MKKTFTFSLLIILIIFQGLSGIAGGVGLIYDPTGEAINIPQSWLEGTMFGDYLIPGIILLVVLGIFPLIVSYGLVRKKEWGAQAAIFIGAALIIWIAVEIIVVGYKSDPPLQMIYGILGVLILLFSVTLNKTKFRSYFTGS
jgi:hypothetical protein